MDNEKREILLLLDGEVIYRSKIKNLVLTNNVVYGVDGEGYQTFEHSGKVDISFEIVGPEFLYNGQ